MLAAEDINTSADENNPRVFPINKTRGIHCSVSLISPPPPQKKTNKQTKKFAFRGSRQRFVSKGSQILHEWKTIVSGLARQMKMLDRSSKI